MEGINERIAKCLSDSGLTKTAFAQKINVSSAFISFIASGKKTPSDRTIADICRVFGVSEVWLRTGQGEPYICLDEDAEFVQVCEEINLSGDSLIKRIIKTYWRMSEDEKAVVRKLIDGISQK